MKKDSIKVLFFGDVVGPLGRSAVEKYLALHKEKDGIDFVIANGENATHGRGMIVDHYKLLKSYGVDCITSGNHFFNVKDALTKQDEMEDSIRPINFDKDCPGKGSKTFTLNDGTKIKVSNLIGRVYINLAQSNPFYDLDNEIEKDGKDVIHIVDFHAEATAEKIVFAHYFDGRVTAVLGTHTHVQTNDAIILEKGTLYMSDVGMNGAFNSSLGDEIDSAMYRTMTGMPAALIVPRTGKAIVNAIEMIINKESKKVIDFKVIKEYYE